MDQAAGVSGGRTLAVADPLMGATVGGFALAEEIGRGGMGVVYRAVHPLLGTQVAVKVLRAELARDESTRSRFVSEGKAAARIRHPNVVQVLDLVTLADGRPCIVQELLDGAPLDAVAGAAPMELARVVRLVGQIAAALTAAHAQGVVHRDVKCQNVLVAPGDSVKLVDFGIAKIALQDVTQTAPGMAVGTPQYMAPEQVLGGEVDARADIYALGVLTWRLLAARFPFQGSHVEVMVKHVKEPARPPPGVPAPVAAVVLSAMAKERALRPASANDFARALADAAGGKQGPAVAVDVATRTVTVAYSSEGALAVAEEQELRWGRLYLADVYGLPRAPLTLQLVTPSSRRTVPAEVAAEFDAAAAARFRVRPGTALAVRRGAGQPEPRVAPAGAGDDLPTRAIPSVALAPCAEGASGAFAVRVPPEEALRTLGELERAARGDHYAFLDVSSTAHPSIVGAALRRLHAALASIARSAPPACAERVEVLEARLLAARAALGEVGARLGYDAELGNWRGVARALAQGAEARVVEAVHRNFSEQHPERVRRAQGERIAAQALARTRRTQAVEAAEHALALDPFDADAHRLYRELTGVERRADGAARATSLS